MSAVDEAPVTGTEKIFSPASSDPFADEKPGLSGKKRAISAIFSLRKSVRGGKPSAKLQDNVKVWEDEAIQMILNFMGQSEKVQKMLKSQIVKLEETVDLGTFDQPRHSARPRCSKASFVLGIRYGRCFFY